MSFCTRLTGGTGVDFFLCSTEKKAQEVAVKVAKEWGYDVDCYTDLSKDEILTQFEENLESISVVVRTVDNFSTKGV